MIDPYSKFWWKERLKDAKIRAWAYQTYYYHKGYDHYLNMYNRYKKLSIWITERIK